MSRASDTPTPTTRLSFVAAFVAVFVLGLFAWPWLSAEDIAQPLEFNHLAHAEYDIECVDCHTRVLTAMDPGLPDNAVCFDCHEEAIGESAAELALIEWLQGDEEIPWRPLYLQPAHVFFSHQRHAAVGEIECSSCHGDFGQLEQPPTSAPHKLTMDECTDCHLQTEVDDDCTSCHR